MSSSVPTPRPSPIKHSVRDADTIFAFNGYFGAFLCLAALAMAALFFWNGFSFNRMGQILFVPESLLLGIFFLFVAGFLKNGIYSLKPNESIVLTLFGSYVGTDSTSGLRMTIPLFGGRKISERVQIFECGTLKVNDLVGNPIEIGAVVAWRVHDCAKAVFQVDDYRAFVGAQAEAALRHIATKYPYDLGEAESATAAGDAAAEKRTAPEQPRMSLRESGAEVTRALIDELRERLTIAGVIVDEARITHLAYAPEIAPVMLRRQQATAVVGARKLIVQGAVDIVDDALKQIESMSKLQLDPERKAAMVSNLLVVLVSDKDATPVINTGTLYG